MKIAIVSGASSGLGREFVCLLDKQEKLDEIWCIARSKEKLIDLQKSVTTSLRLLSYDLTQKESIYAVQAVLEKEAPDVKFLINAAGIGKIGSYKDITLSDCAAMADLNCRAAMMLTQIALPFMQTPSHIMEICSTAAFQPLPYFNVYAASKSFLYYYSRALNVELAPRRISVTAVCPYWIKDTNFISTAQNTKDNTYIKNFVFGSHKQKIAAKALHDAERGYAVSTPGVICTLHRLTAKFVPFSFMMYVWNLLRRMRI